MHIYTYILIYRELEEAEKKLTEFEGFSGFKEVLALKDKCFDGKDGKFTYNVCILEKLTQSDTENIGIYICMHMCVYIYVYIYYMYTYIYMYICIYAHMYTYIHIYMNMYTYIYIHLYAYTYMHTLTYIQALLLLRWEVINLLKVIKKQAEWLYILMKVLTVGTLEHGQVN
jgi:hypothetical protein